MVRVWVPDRPGALGSVASRIGAVRGDLVAIDILERGAGRAIDELVVELPEADLVPLLVKEMNEVDGVDVEEVRLVSEAGRPDPRLAALEAAADIVAQRSPLTVLDALTLAAAREFDVAWAAVTDAERGVVASAGRDHPPDAWLLAFAAGASPGAATGDVTFAALPSSGMGLVAGRPGRPLRALERRQLAVLTAIADTRWAELSRKTALAVHPSSHDPR